MVKGLIRISIFSLLVLFLVFLLKDVLEVEEVHSWMYWLIGFFWLINALIHSAVHFLENSIDIDVSMLLLAAVSARLIIALFSFLIMAMSGVDDIKLFAINFSVLYLLFLVFEISSVLSNLRRNSSEDQIDD